MGSKISFIDGGIYEDNLAKLFMMTHPGVNLLKIGFEYLNTTWKSALNVTFTKRTTIIFFLILFSFFFSIINGYLLCTDLLVLFVFYCLFNFAGTSNLLLRLLLYIGFLSIFFSFFMDDIFESFFYSVNMNLWIKYIFLLAVPVTLEIIHAKYWHTTKIFFYKYLSTLIIIALLLLECFMQLNIFHSSQMRSPTIGEYNELINVLKRNIPENSYVYGMRKYWIGLLDHCNFIDLSVLYYFKKKDKAQKYFFVKYLDYTKFDYLIVDSSFKHTYLYTNQKIMPLQDAFDAEFELEVACNGVYLYRKLY